MRDPRTGMLAALKSRIRQALICISLLIGVWLMIESLAPGYYILKTDRSTTLVDLYTGILLFGVLLFAAGLLLMFGKKIWRRQFFPQRQFFRLSDG